MFRSSKLFVTVLTVLFMGLIIAVPAFAQSVTLDVDPEITAAEGEQVTLTASLEGVPDGIDLEYRFAYRKAGAGNKIYFPQQGPDSVWSITIPEGAAGDWDLGVQVRQAGTSGWSSPPVHHIVPGYVITEDPVDMEATIFDKAGTYGPEDADDPDTIVGDVIVKADGVTLQNYIITGDLIIAEEVGDGEVTLNNLEVKGELIIRGGGADSIYINGGEYSNIRIEEVDGKVRVVAVGATDADGNPVDVVIAEGAIGEDIFLEGDFDEIDIDAESSTVNICATVNVANISAGGVTVNLCAEAEINQLNVDGEDATVQGDGKVNNANVNADGCSFQEGVVDPDDVTVGEGVEDPTYFAPDPDPGPGPTFYPLTVEAMPADYGVVEGTGNYIAGTEVDIKATPDTDKYFFKWQAEPDVGTFGDPYKADTTYTMPAQAVTITAYFSDEDPETHPVLNITQGTGHETIQDAITGAIGGDEIWVSADTYVVEGQIIIDKDLTIVGADKETTIIKPDAGYTSKLEGWFEVNSGVTFNLSNVKLDGDGYLIYNAIYFDGNGEINNCWFTNIQYNASGPTFRGTGILVTTDAGNVDIKNSLFTDIGRDGIRHRSTGTVSGNTYTGKGETGPDENWFDYFILAEFGCDIVIDDNTVTQCAGEVTTDSGTWRSAAIAIWDDDNTTAVLTDNVLSDNDTGIHLQGAYGDGTSLTVEIGDGNMVSGGEYGIRLHSHGDHNYTPALTFTGTTTIKGPAEQAIWLGENIADGTNYDISGVIFKDAADNQITDNFEIEDIVYHALDAENRGLFVWNPSNVYVTTSTLGIQRGIDLADPGDTVEVHPGTYMGRIDIDVPNLTLRSTEGWDMTIIDADEATMGVWILKDLGDVTVDGFTVRNWKYGGIVQSMGNSEGTASHILNNFSTPLPVGPTGHGNSIQVSGDGSTVIGNKVEVRPYPHSSDDSPTGILNIGADDVIIQGNHVYDVEGGYEDGGTYGIAVGGHEGHNWGIATNNVVEGNTVEGMRKAGIVLWGSVVDASIQDNSVTGNKVGIYNYERDGYAPTGTAVHFNSIVDNTEWGVLNTATVNPTPTTVVNATNNWWGDASGPSGEGPGTGNAVSENVLFSPWWADEDGNTTGELPD